MNNQDQNKQLGLFTGLGIRNCFRFFWTR